MPTLEELANDPGKLVTEFQVTVVRDFPARIVVRGALVDGTAVSFLCGAEVAHRLSDDLLRAAAAAKRPLTAAEL